MINLIPRPCSAKECGCMVPFSSKTRLTGEFGSIFELLSQLLPTPVRAGDNQLTFVRDDRIAKEGYHITCAEQNICITVSDAAGAFYGVMTLLQLCAGKDWFQAVECPVSCYSKGVSSC